MKPSGRRLVSVLECLRASAAEYFLISVMSTDGRSFGEPKVPCPCASVTIIRKQTRGADAAVAFRRSSAYALTRVSPWCPVPPVARRRLVGDERVTSSAPRHQSCHDLRSPSSVHVRGVPVCSIRPVPFVICRPTLVLVRWCDIRSVYRIIRRQVV